MLLLPLLLLSLSLPWRADCSVVLINASSYSLAFCDIEASFAQRIPSVGVVGSLFAAKPLNACQPLTSMENIGVSGFLLSERGGCNFVTKVKHAQDAGYAAAIIYNNDENEDLITMSGSGIGIHIYAVFVTKKAGQTLYSSIEEEGSRCYLFPTSENAAKSLIAISFIFLLTVFAIFSTLFFVRRHRYRRASSVGQEREAGGMAWKDVKALTVILFDSDIQETGTMCAICLEDYRKGEKLRVLPCGHEFHVPCIDQWLTTQRCFCPICKKDAHTKGSQKVPSERTPLLASCVPGFNTMNTLGPPVQDPQFIPHSAERCATTAPVGSQQSLSCPMLQLHWEDEGLTQGPFHTHDGYLSEACSCSSPSNNLLSTVEEVVVQMKFDV